MEPGTVVLTVEQKVLIAIEELKASIERFEIVNTQILFRLNAMENKAKKDASDLFDVGKEITIIRKKLEVVDLDFEED